MSDGIEIVIDGTDKGFLATVQKAVRAENEVADGLKKVKSSADGASTSMKGLGDSSVKALATNSVRDYAAGMISVAAAIGVARQAISLMNTETAEAISSFTKLRDVRK